MIPQHLAAPSNFKCGLLQGDTVQIKGKRFRVDRWNCNGFYTLEFIDVSEIQLPPFKRNPMYIKGLYDRNEIEVVGRVV